MKANIRSYEIEMEGKTFKFETGKLAGQAGGSVTLQFGDSMALAAVTMSKEARQGTDFLPLTVDYEERMYAGGRIPGSFFRREGRPGEEAILTARLVDRPLRPLFPKGLRNDIQVIIYSLSTDGENPMDILAINAASAALMISDIPWNGPIAAIRVGLVDEKFIANPTFEQSENSNINLRIAGTREAILMVESSSDIVSEETIVAALEFGHKAMQPIIDCQEKMALEVGKAKREYTTHTIDEGLLQNVTNHLYNPIRQIFEQPYEKASFYGAIDDLREKTIQEFAVEDEALQKDVNEIFEQTLNNIVRKRILDQDLRIDGRNSTEIRPIWCEVNVSPRAHGSGLFTRGETQALTLATLGTPREAQELDNLTPSDYKRYMHHYNFPPFSVGETRPLRGTSRREVGHGALAERALIPVIPSDKEFPYTLRLVSEVLSSNGSSSMASVCGSTLALMDTGVPIKAPVAGVAMGLIKEDGNYRILTDILGAEDHFGDMDFKVAGTREGITALQMDIKVAGLTSEIMSQALDQAKTARLFILDKMMETIATPNQNLKEHAPRMDVVQIPVDKIGAVIGPGGKTIRAIQEDTGAKIDIGEDGTVFISTSNAESALTAREQIEALTESAEVGRIYTGKVVRVTDFGAFVEILPNIDGLVHISQLDTQRVNKVEDVVRRGDEITVMVTDIDETGRIRLSRQAVLEGWTAEEAAERDRPSSGRSSNKPSGNRSGSRRKSNYNKDRR